MPIQKCDCVKVDGRKCMHDAVKGHSFCEFHLFLDDYTKEERDAFTDICKRCKTKFKKINSNQCPHCESKVKNQNVKHKLEKSKQYFHWYKIKSRK